MENWEKINEDIKVVWLLHFVGNIVSGGLLWTVWAVLFLVLKDGLSDETRQACYNIINFNISYWIYMGISFLLMFVLIWFLTTPIIAIIWFVSLIIGFLKHLEWKNYEYPLTINFLK